MRRPLVIIQDTKVVGPWEQEFLRIEVAMVMGDIYRLDSVIFNPLLRFNNRESFGKFRLNQN